jgi:hypothetical protein
MALDVNPPRAGKWAKRIRRTVPIVGRARVSAARNWRDASDVFHRSVGVIPIPPRRLFWRLPVPGWPQMRAGRRVQGQRFLLAYLICLALSLVFYGWMLGAIFLGLAVAIHIGSIFDVIDQDAPVCRRETRTGVFIIIAAVMMLGVYGPPAYLANRFAVPYTAEQISGNIYAGDIVILNRGWNAPPAPQRGDVELYNIGTMLVGRIRYRTQSIGRVLAVQGDHIACKDGKLYVNGQLSAWQPLGDVAWNFTGDMTIAPGTVFIPVSGLPAGGFAIVSVADCLGRVYWHMSPLWRLGPIR